MAIFTAIKRRGNQTPTVAVSSSLKAVQAWAQENGGHYVKADELRALRRSWRDTGGQPSVVVDLDAQDGAGAAISGR